MREDSLGHCTVRGSGLPIIEQRCLLLAANNVQNQKGTRGYSTPRRASKVPPTQQEARPALSLLAGRVRRKWRPCRDWVCGDKRNEREALRAPPRPPRGGLACCLRVHTPGSAATLPGQAALSSVSSSVTWEGGRIGPTSLGDYEE